MAKEEFEKYSIAIFKESSRRSTTPKNLTENKTKKKRGRYHKDAAKELTKIYAYKKSV